MSDHAEHAEQHHPNYVRIWAILVVLLLISVAGPEIGSRTGLQVITLVTAFGIALVKAWLVIKNFMHLNIEKRLMAYMLTTCLVFMLLFFAGTAPDIMKFEGTNWTKTDYETPPPAGHHEEGADHGGDAAAHGGGMDAHGH